MEKKTFRVVREAVVKIPETLQTLSSGETAEVTCGEFAILGSVHSAACRLNKAAGWKEFEVSTPDNGATIVVRRNASVSAHSTDTVPAV